MDHQKLPPVAQVWRAGRPETPGGWTDYDTDGRSEWLTALRLHGGIGQQDAPAETEYRLDGAHISDEPAFYIALGEAVNGPGGYFGSNLDALADCLRGYFGATSPFTLVWDRSEVARDHLTRSLADRQPYFEAILNTFEEGGVTVRLG